MFGVADLLRAGLKPVARIPVRSEAEVAELTRGVPHSMLSPLRFGVTPQGKVKAQVSTDGSFGERILYFGQLKEEVERACAVDNDILVGKLNPRLHEELGDLLGFPHCCAKAFADRKSIPRLILNEASRALSRGPRKPEFRYMLLGRLDWHLKPIEPDCNFLSADQFRLPIVVHVPCAANCAVTCEQVEKAVTTLLDDAGQRAIRDILALGSVVWADDRLVFFHPLALPDTQGVVPLTGFNADAVTLTDPYRRQPQRSFPADAGGVTDAEVNALRVRRDRLEVRVGNDWKVYAPAGVVRGMPILVVPRPAPTT